jgi:RimJ/RimL family protein N-acetyltransferase
MIEAGNVEHARLITQAAGTFFNPECDRVVSWTADGKLLGGVTFTCFRTASIQMHIASFDDRFVSRSRIRFVFHYAFEQLGVRKIILTIPSGNLKSVQFCQKLGFSEEARVTDAFPDGDLILMTMRAADCRWI